MAYAVTNRGHFGQRRRARQDHEHQPQPQTRMAGPFSDCPAGKLTDKVAVIAGGDSGIGRAVAIAFAREGADIAIVYLNEHRGAEETRRAIQRENVRCILVAEDTASEGRCRRAIKRIIAAFGRLDILVNNAAEQQPQGQPSRDPRDVAPERREQTLRTNLLDMFYLTAAAMPHLPAGGAIINTTAVTAWRDSAYLIDDDATTATIASFTRSLAEALIARGIRANAVTPGPVGAPPIRGTFRSGSRWEYAPAFGKIAPGYVSLAAENDLFMTGQVVHAKAGETVA